MTIDNGAYTIKMGVDASISTFVYKDLFVDDDYLIIFFRIIPNATYEEKI